MSKGRFSQSNEDACRLPDGMRRVAYDADTQRYTFRDRAGQLYQSAPGEEYGVLRPVVAPLSHRRNVTITEIPDPALRQWSRKPAKTFGDILPPGYITTAQSGVTSSPTRALASPERLMQAAIPKVRGAAEIVRHRTTVKRRTPPPPRASAGSSGLHRSESLMDERRRLLEDDDTDEWEIVRKEDVAGVSRLGRSKSEMRPSRYHNYNSRR